MYRVSIACRRRQARPGSTACRWTCTAILAASAVTGAPPAALAQFVEPDVEVLYTLTSEVPGDGFGWAADAIGDIDGDGASEIIIGAPFSASGGPSSGKAFVFSGRTGARLNIITGAPFDRMGHGVAGIGDADNDGIADYAAGGPGTSPQVPLIQRGHVIAVSGAKHTSLHDVAGPAHLSFFGYDLGGAGDVNHDGHDDMLVGAPFHSPAGPLSGSVHFISGRDGTTIRSHAGPVQSGFGSAVSKVRDQNLDGVADHAVGAFFGGEFQTGEAYVLSGLDGLRIKTLRARNTGVQFGNFFVHDAGDINADGCGDIFVGDFADGGLAPSSGLGYVFFGGRSGRRLFPAQTAGEGLGPGRGAGDVNRDGYDDIVMAAFISNAGAVGGGKVYLFSGRNGKVLRTMTGNVARAQLGFDVLPVGDVNDDRRIDFLVTGSGVAHLVLGTKLKH